MIFLWSCVTTPDPSSENISLEAATTFIPSHVTSRSEWARDIVTAINVSGKSATPERVCAVVATIEQESGFKTDPVVPNLPRIVRDGLRKKFSKLGILADAAVAALLTGHAPGSKESFEQRIAKLKTERDLDVFFRDLATAYQDKLPGTYLVASAISRILGKGSLRNLNPVTTIGSMQVKVSFAKGLEEFEGLDDDALREQLYTRTGGVLAGTVRLLGYEASYDDVIYRFADYNAGVYASRNAAFQKQLGDLTGIALIQDGDLLAYDEDGDDIGTSQSLQALRKFGKNNDMWMTTVRRAAAKEKSHEFEETSIWENVREAWQDKFQRTPAYAQMPKVTLASPKLLGPRSTEWFAKNVKRRYEACRARSAPSG